MSQFVLQNETIIRLGFFLGVLALIAAWEVLNPRRVLTQNKLVRWYSNIGIVALNTIALRVVFPITAAGFAILAEQKSWGLFHNLSFSFGLKVLLSVIVLDLAIYLQHVMFHAVPALWRLHRMHQADLDFDVTTGARFHTIEILLSMAIKFSVIFVIGAPAISVIIFEVLLNATSMFNHGNIFLSPKFDRYLRWLVVTPDMHRVHHSIYMNETNSNFGFNLPWWDRLLGTYRSTPKDGHEKMTIGTEFFREPKYLKLHWLLAQPFLRNRDNAE